MQYHRAPVTGKLIRALLIIVFLFSAVNSTQATPVSAQAATPVVTFPPDWATITATGENGTIAAPPQALPVFSWDPVTNAKTYRIQFSQTPAFSTFTEFITPLNQYTPLNVSQFNDGTWYWHVRVETPTPASSYSDIRSFNKDWASEGNQPALIAPGNGATIEFFDPPVFSWTPVIGAASYRLKVSTDANLLSNIKIDKTTLTTSYQDISELPNGLYYWQVTPIDPANHSGTPSNIYSFSMGYNEVPVLIEPANLSTPTFTPVFRWAAVRGALKYYIQISTDPTFGTGKIVDTATNNTTFTYTSTLENDKNYYWRVRAYNGSDYSGWSNQNTSPWYFTKRWYIQPVLLTPIKSFQYVRFPFFSWTPVPGAATYKIEISYDPGMTNPIAPTPATTINTFYSPETYYGLAGIRYWRVTPYDNNGKPGVPSEVGQYYSFQEYNAPDLVSPLYYYPPNTFPAPDQSVVMRPYEDRSVAYPLFTWSRVFDVYSGETVGKAYRLRVGTMMNPNGTVGNVVWSVDTENLSAAPKTTEFTPVPGTVYYWQVTPLDGINGNQVGQISQAWKTRFDPAKALPGAAAGSVPQPLRPTYSSTYDVAINPGYDSAEFVEITPALEWFPVSGAGSYDVQISRNSSFSLMVDSATVDQPVYAPRTSFGQRSLNHLGFGSYYWRVKVHGAATWSAPWRFQIAAQSQWQGARVPGDTANRLKIASDIATGEVSADYDLNGLYASQDKDYWYFGLDYSGSGNSTYVLYMDTDNRDNSGAVSDARGYPLTTNFAHRPEYVIYIDKTAGSFDASRVTIFHWLANANPPAWDTGVTLAYVGGTVFPAGNYLELKIPYDPIGMQLETGTYSLALASVDATNQVRDAVPDNAITSGSANLDQFTTVSEHLSLSAPLSDLTGDPNTYPSTPPYFWNAPSSSLWAGFWARVYLDSQFTKQQGEQKIVSTGNYYAPTSNAWKSDIMGDNTYYWRVRPRYLVGSTEYYGSWSQAWRYDRRGFVAQNLQVSVTSATPTFTWDRAEGAATYKLYVDNSPDYSSREIDITTNENSYTPTVSLANGLYHWKVLITRKNGETSDWSPEQTFTLALPQPTGLTPNSPDKSVLVKGTPTFCWNSLSVTNGAGEPVLFATKYRLVISKGDPNFSAPYETVDTVQNCWTPTKGYDDATYYWKVSMLDGGGNQGAYSPVAIFTKQYPTARPLSPVSGSQAEQTPVFRWTAADGVTPYVFGAASYRIEVSSFANFSTPDIDSATTNATVFTPTKVYATGKTIYWRVAIIDKDGKIGPFTNAWILMDKNKVYLALIKK